MPGVVLVAEETIQVRILERIVVRQGDFVDVVGIDEGFPRLMASSISSAIHVGGIFFSQ